MITSILGKKLGMTQIFDEKGKVIPVTVIEAGPVKVTQVKTKDSKDGYEAVQIGFGESKRLNQPQLGHQKGLTSTIEVGGGKFTKEVGLKHLREVKSTDMSAHEVGQTITVDQVFAAGETVDVTGTSKGKGFAGVMKRHGFGGGPRTHGQSDRQRAPGSIGPGTTPGRVVKGLRMAGHMGSERVTTQNLKVVRVDAERNLILIKGAVPGANGGIVTIRKAVKAGK
jgi:large subunit ribosomal protein L3